MVNNLRRRALFSDELAQIVTEYAKDFNHATALIAFVGIAVDRGFDVELARHLRPFMEKKLEKDIDEINQTLNN